MSFVCFVVFEFPGMPGSELVPVPGLFSHRAGKSGQRGVTVTRGLGAAETKLQLALDHLRISLTFSPIYKLRLTPAFVVLELSCFPYAVGHLPLATL